MNEEMPYHTSLFVSYPISPGFVVQHDKMIDRKIIKINLLFNTVHTERNVRSTPMEKYFINGR